MLRNCPSWNDHVPVAQPTAAPSGISDGHLHRHTWLTADGSDLLDNLPRAVQISDALVGAHLVAVPGLGAFTARGGGGVAGGDAQNLGGGHARRSLTDLQLLVFCALDQVSAHVFQTLHIAAGQGDADTMDGS